MISRRLAVEAALSSARTTVQLLEAELATLPETGERLDLIGVDAALADYGVGRQTLKAAARRGELEISSGARGKLLVSRAALEAWLKSRKYEPPPKPAKAEPANDSADDWDSRASAQLRSIAGGRR